MPPQAALTPQVRIVVLNYDSANLVVPFGPSPRQVPIRPNDTIQFQIGASTRAVQPGCKLRITLHDSRNFSQKTLQHSPAQTGAEDLTVTVLPGLEDALAGLPAPTNHVITAYKCELLDANGQPIPGLFSDGSDGGEMVPDSVGN